MDACEDGQIELTVCPDPACLQVAEVVDAYVLESTDGPVGHLTTLCLSRHRFTNIVPAWDVLNPEEL